ncbi:hypothetical protein Tsubulata_046953, partial [Turnera subulata]
VEEYDFEDSPSKKSRKKDSDHEIFPPGLLTIHNALVKIQNFKKCLIKMFAELVSLEMVMGLAQQRPHCLIECVPLPRGIAKVAPLYFKKAIDEAEDEWCQHTAKKLIATSEKGLSGAIPKIFSC